MSSKRILIVGCGKIGLRVANLLTATNDVWGLRRSIPNEDNQKSDNSELIQFITADVCKPDTLIAQLPENLDYLIYCVAPTERNEAAYRSLYLQGLQNIVSALPDQASLKRLYFVSSTSVYHQNDHSLVDEASPTLPTSFSGQVLLEAESFCNDSSIPSTIIRFSGIYGGGRSHLIKQVQTHQAKLSSDSRLTNRIHEDDCVGFIQHLIQEEISGRTNKSLYLASDNIPIDLNDVIKFLASNLDIKALEKPSENAARRRAGNKRCSNKRMLKSGYKLHFPSYQEGYLAMIESAKNTNN